MGACRRLVIAALPWLLGSSVDPGSCPPVSGSDAFDITISSVEQTTYTCAVDKLDARLNRCVSVDSGDCTLTLRGNDGSSRTATPAAAPAIGVGWCDVPAGHYDITLCSRAGPLECGVDIAEND
ncbi:MAG TPA: hypothetical protein VGG28_32260, partial [Kofleriaceae bacterium]